jgi:hypothetical protein
VGSNYEYNSPTNSKVWWQGAALLTADCLGTGTGILAPPGDIQVLGYIRFGLGFYIANLTIFLFADTILSHTATHVEESQGVANQIFHESLSDNLLGEHGKDSNYEAINANTTTLC